MARHAGAQRAEPLRPESDLSDVAFMWIVHQAEKNGGLEGGIIDRRLIASRDYDTVTEPTANDRINTTPEWYLPNSLYWPGRHFRYLDKGGDTDVLQKEFDVVGGAENLDFESGLAFLEEDIYQDNNMGATFGKDYKNDTALKQGAEGKHLYQRWLKENYGLEIDIKDGESRN
jgi:hypothetical protein